MEILFGSKAVVPVDLQSTTFTDKMTLRYSIESDRLIFVIYSEYGETFGPGSGTAVEIVFDIDDVTNIPRDPNFGLEFGDILLANTNAGIIPLKPRAEVEQDPALPQSYTLSQNYPNPFNPVTNIRYSLPVGDRRPETGDRIHTTLKIYNILGQEVQTLVDKEKEPGHYTVTWDGRDDYGEEVSSGVYFYTLKAGEFTDTKRMLLLK
jgi:hypothetical protein